LEDAGIEPRIVATFALAAGQILTSQGKKWKKSKSEQENTAHENVKSSFKLHHIVSRLDWLKY